MANYFESKRLREERKEIVDQMQSIGRIVANEQRPMTAEEVERYDRLNQSQEDLKNKIESAERVERLEALVVSTPESPKPYQHKAKVVTRKDHEKAFRAWALRQGGYSHLIRSEDMEAADRVGLNTNDSQLVVKLLGDAPENLASINRTVTDQITDPANGENVEMIQGIEKAMYTYGDMLNAAQVIRTPNGNTLPWVTVDDVDGTNQPQLAAARAKVDEITSTSFALGRISLGAFSAGSGVLPVANETLQDSGINLTGLISELLGERIARKENKWYTSGNSTTEPQGIETAITPTILFQVGDGSTTATDWHGILTELEFGVDAFYTKGPKVGYMFPRTVAKSLALMVDGMGRPLFRPSLAVGTPDTIAGYPFWINTDMTANTLIFGDFSKFIVRSVDQVVISVLRERMAERNATAFVAHHRSDSGCVNLAALVCAQSTTGSVVTVPADELA